MMDNEFKYEDNKLYRKDKQTKKWICGNNIKPNNWGYIRIGVNGKHLYLHRLVYKYHNMDWDMFNNPRENQIDHIDINKLNNSIENLRVVTQSQNIQNRTYYGGKKISGVYFRKDRKKQWCAKWYENGKLKSKYFATELEALNYRKEMVAKYYTHAPQV